MLIIFGTRFLMHVVGSGTFLCPQCDQDMPYTLRGPRRWFTLFFIPVIPLDRAERFVQCQECNSQWTLQVLQVPTIESFSTNLQLGMRACVSSVLNAGPPLDGDDLAWASAGLVEFMSDAYTVQHLQQDIAAFRGVDPEPYLAPVAQQMSVEGKEHFLRRIFLITLPLNGRTQEHLDQAMDIGRLLGVTRTHASGILQEAAASLPAAN